MPYRDVIRVTIELMAGLRVIRSYDITMTLPDVEALYRKVTPEELWSVTVCHFVGRVCEVNIVEGEDAVDRMVAICGDKTDPAECATGTIRRVFAIGRNVSVGDKTFYLNVIHRPKPGEVERDFGLFHAEPWLRI